MATLAERVKHEIVEAISPAIFFFVAFQIIAFTRALMLEEYGIRVSTFVATTIAALVTAKVILLADLLPWINRYPEKPLLYNVVWKTVIYQSVALVVRYLEHLVEFLRQHQSLAEAQRHLMAEIIWAHFWAIQIWMVTLLFVYCALRELTRALGPERVRGMFLGPGTTGLSR